MVRKCFHILLFCMTRFVWISWFYSTGIVPHKYVVHHVYKLGILLLKRCYYGSYLWLIVFPIVTMRVFLVQSSCVVYISFQVVFKWMVIVYSLCCSVNCIVVFYQQMQNHYGILLTSTLWRWSKLETWIYKKTSLWVHMFLLYVIHCVRVYCHRRIERLG